MRSMSDDHDPADPPAHEGAVAHHQTEDHSDDHGPAEEALGPIDVAAWGAGLLGLVIGVVIAACFVLATSAPV